METGTKNQAVAASEDKCLPITGDIRIIGDPITQTTATTYVKNYRDAVNDDPATHNYGFVFGLAKIDAFRAEIEAYNATPEAVKKIAGIRVFFGLTVPSTVSNPTPPDRAVDTVFLMPVLEDGTDLYKVHDLIVNVSILGNPRPCPNECKKLYFIE